MSHYVEKGVSFGSLVGPFKSSELQRFVWAIVRLYRSQLHSHQGSYNKIRGCKCSSHCDYGEDRVLGYINNMLGFSPVGLTDDNFDSFLALAEHFGLRLPEGHTSPPGPVCIALGLQFHVVNSIISLPEDKVVALTTMLKEWLGKPEKEPASLAG